MARVEGLGDLLRRLDAVASTPEILLEEWQTRTVEEAKNLHQPNKKTGMTSASIQQGHRSKDDAEVTADGAAVYLEHGTKAHTIRPRRARMLAWAPDAANRRLSGRTRKGTKTSNMRFAHVVHHPGTKPYPFLEPGAKAALDKVDWPEEVIKRWNEAG